MQQEAEMFKTEIHTGNKGVQYFCVMVPDFIPRNLVIAQDLALKSGYDPYRPARMTEQGGRIKWYAFSRERIRQLFNGKYFYKIYTAMDANGNKIAKVFYMDGTSEIIKDARLPLHSDKTYKSIPGLRKSK